VNRCASRIEEMAKKGLKKESTPIISEERNVHMADFDGFQNTRAMNNNSSSSKYETNEKKTFIHKTQKKKKKEKEKGISERDDLQLGDPVFDLDLNLMISNLEEAHEYCFNAFFHE
jgi:hypothetical protein